MGRLFWKFFIASALAIVLVAAGVGASVWLFERPRLPALQGLSIDPRAGQALREAAAVLQYGGLDALRRFNGTAEAAGRPVAVAIDAAGRDALGRAVNEAALREARDFAREDPASDRPGPRPTRTLAAPDGTRYLVFMQQVAFDSPPPPPPQQPGPSYPWRIILFGALASLALSGGLAWYFAAPARVLRQAFDSMGEGRLTTRVAPLLAGRRDEIADLGHAFDTMAQRVESLVQAQRRLLHDVSHELRSPLARVSAAIGLARQRPEELTVTLDRLERECERLDQLVGELLTLSRLESGVGAPQLQRVEVAPLLEAILDDALFEAEQSARRVEATAVPVFAVMGQPELLSRAFENAIRNAIKYTAPGTAVQVAARIDAGQGLEVVVSDCGPGVPEADLQQIFAPFYRGDGDRHRQGFGLGLAIAERAVAAHGGRITARNRAQGGLEVTIWLPQGGASR